MARGRGGHSLEWLANHAFPPKTSPPSSTDFQSLSTCCGSEEGGHSKDTCVPSMLGTQAGGKGMQEETGKAALNIENTQLVYTASILRKRQLSRLTLR